MSVTFFGFDITVLLIPIILFESAMIFSFWISLKIIEQSNNKPVSSVPLSINDGESSETTLVDRDKFIFDLIQTRYESEWDRSKVLDSKASKLMGFIGLIITLETTLILFMFREMKDLTFLPESVRLIFFSLIILGILTLFCSALLSLLAIFIKKWPIVPDTSHLLNNYTNNNVGIRSVIGANGRQISNAIITCISQNNDKADLLKIAYILFFIGVFITMAIMFILVLVVYPQQIIIINT